MGLLACTPFIQLILLLGFSIDEASAFFKKQQQRTKERDAFLTYNNTLFQCRACGFIQRRYQLQDENATPCCQMGNETLMEQVVDEDVYAFARETGITPLMLAKTAKKRLKEEKRVVHAVRVKKKNEKKEKEQKQKMNRLLEKTRFIQEQNKLYLEKEHKKLTEMNAELNVRKDEVLNTLTGEQKEEFIQAMIHFELVRKREMDRLQAFEEESKQKLAHLQRKVEA